MSGIPLLSLLIVVPLLAGVLCLFMKAPGARWVALIGTLIDFALSLYVWAKYDPDAIQEPYRRFREKGRMPGILQGSDCWALPTLADGRLYLRDHKQLVCLDVRK